MLDSLHPAVRHLLIVAGATALGYVLNSVLGAGGVTEVDWARVAIDGANQTAMAVATAAAALWGLPLTRQYGVGSGDPAPAARR